MKVQAETLLGAPSPIYAHSSVQLPLKGRTIFPLADGQIARLQIADGSKGMLHLHLACATVSNDPQPWWMHVDMMTIQL